MPTKSSRETALSDPSPLPLVLASFSSLSPLSLFASALLSSVRSPMVHHSERLSLAERVRAWRRALLRLGDENDASPATPRRLELAPPTLTLERNTVPTAMVVPVTTCASDLLSAETIQSISLSSASCCRAAPILGNLKIRGKVSFAGKRFIKTVSESERRHVAASEGAPPPVPDLGGRDRVPLRGGLRHRVFALLLQPAKVRRKHTHQQRRAPSLEPDRTTSYKTDDACMSVFSLSPTLLTDAGQARRCDGPREATWTSWRSRPWRM